MELFTLAALKAFMHWPRWAVRSADMKGKVELRIRSRVRIMCTEQLRWPDRSGAMSGWLARIVGMRGSRHVRHFLPILLLAVIVAGCGSPTETRQVSDLTGTYSLVPVPSSSNEPEQAYLLGLLEIVNVRDSGEFSGQTQDLQICDAHRQRCSSFVPSPGLAGEIGGNGEFEAVLFAFGHRVAELRGTFQDGALRGTWVSSVSENGSGIFVALRE